MNAKCTLLKTTLASVLLATAGMAHAGITYSFATGGSSSSVGGIGNAQRIYNPGGGNPTLTMTGFVNTINAAGDSPLGLAGPTSGQEAAEFTYAPIAFHGSTNGLGIQFTPAGGTRESSPEHATDNSGNQEFMLLSFSSPVALTDLQLGWPDTGTTRDTDFMVMRFAGPAGAAGSPTLDGFTAADMLLLNSNPGDTVGNSRGLTTAGWEIMGKTTAGNGNVTLTTDDMPVNDTSRSIGNSTFQSSSFWLVGARNSWLAAGSDGRADFGKLLSVKACVAGTTGCTAPDGGPSVPEPGTLSLLGLGLIGTLGLRRRRTA
jgi:hypothetical protein